jgi:hypothetical protein
VLIAQRVRPAPCVHANLKVPVSSSRASTGAPMNAPTSTGTANIRLDTVCAPLLCSAELSPPQYALVNSCRSCWHLDAAAGWQAATVA